MSLDAYKIGIQIALVDNVSRGLLAIAAQFESVNKSAEKLETRLERVKKLTEFGSGLFKAGNEAAHMWDKQVDAASKYHAVLERIGRFDAGAAAANEKFLKGLDIKGMSLTDVGQLFGGAQTILQSSTQAQDVTKLLAQVRTAFGSATGVKDGAQLDSMTLTALKVAQMRDGVIGKDGKIDTKKVEETFNMLVNTALASGGGVLPKDYLEAMQGGKLSGALKPSEAAVFGLKQFMQANGGSKAGVEAMSALQGWVAGNMPATVAHELERVKLLDPKAVRRDKAGHITGVDATGLKDVESFAKNPLQYLLDEIVPALQKRGYAGDSLNAKLGNLLGIQGEKNILEQLQHDKERAGLYLANAGKGPGAVKLYEKDNEGLEGKLKDYEAKKANLNIALGEHVLPLAIAGLEKFNGLIGGITHLAQEFPGTTKAIMAFATGLAFLHKVSSTLSVPLPGGDGGMRGGGFVRGVARMARSAATGALRLGAGVGRASLSMLRAGGGLGRGLLSAAGTLMESPVASKAPGVLGRGSGLISAAYGGYKLGGYVNDNVISPLIERVSGVKGATLGTFLYDVLHGDTAEKLPVTKPDSSHGISAPSTAVKVAEPKLVYLKGDVTMDGRSVGQVVWKQIEGHLARPQTGSSTFNTGMQLMPSGL
ncbi:phage tail tape measure protein [Ralstonia pickettii]|uniref:Phage tail tape measure protein n=1 Tax=Ralstonia pickettii TaxID=329 RepID=A0A2N4TRC2_RALPI|nr:phage tail tape measure protein [Ralstonia pickettii]PLC42260.1 phage tail tape measure protein [Ralstonia pickettii]